MWLSRLVYSGQKLIFNLIKVTSHNVHRVYLTALTTNDNILANKHLRGSAIF